MSRTAGAWATIAVAGLGTYAIRASLLLAAARLAAPPRPVREILRVIPPAALAALAAPALLRPSGALEVVNPHLVAGLLAGVVAWRTRNVLATVIVGVLAVLLLDPLLR